MIRKILFVDDEPLVLEGLGKSLRGFRNRWAVEFASTGEEALRKLSGDAFEVVVSDARMPGIDGEQLLGAVQARWPSMVRIILSGQTEADCGRRLVHVAHQFIAKPVHSSDLFDTVERACRLGDLLGQPALRSMLCGLDRLPAFPWIHSRLAQALDEGADLLRVARIIGQSPSLAARTLQMVNSAFFGVPKPVVGIREAVLLLGLDACRELLRSTRPFLGDGPMVDEISRRAVILARLTSLALAGSGLSEAGYAAGLLSQLGVLVLAGGLGEGYRPVWEEHLNGMPLEEAENKFLANSHCEVGAGLLGLWNVPAAVVDAVALHRSDPFVEERPGLTSALTLAAVVECEQRGEGWMRRQTDGLAAQLGMSERLPGMRQLCSEGAGPGHA